MKIDRLIGILSILLQQEKITAPELAEKFEVSRRTINRDIEDLCKAGIPLVTTQGQAGGISIMEGFKIDRTLLTSSDMQSILAGLSSLDSISGTNRYQQLMDKLSVGSSSILTSNSHILIDLASWYKETLTPKIETLQAAIHAHQLITFHYYAPKKTSLRTIEPYLLIFQWSSWYIWGYCLDRNDYRMFKLNRVLELVVTEEEFVPKQLPPYEFRSESVFPDQYQVVAVFEPSEEWRLVDEFGIDSFKKRPDGKLLFQFGFTDKEHLFSWISSFGNKAELLEPKALREEFSHSIRDLFHKYF